VSYILMSDLALGQMDAAAALENQAASILAATGPLFASGDPEKIAQAGAMQEQAAILQQQAAAMRGTPAPSSDSGPSAAEIAKASLDTITKAASTGFGIFGALEQAKATKAAVKAAQRPQPSFIPTPTFIGAPSGGGMSGGTVALIAFGAIALAALVYLATRPEPQVAAPAAAPAPAPAPQAA